MHKVVARRRLDAHMRKILLAPRGLPVAMCRGQPETGSARVDTIETTPLDNAPEEGILLMYQGGLLVTFRIQNILVSARRGAPVQSAREQSARVSSLVAQWDTAELGAGAGERTKFRRFAKNINMIRI